MKPSFLTLALGLCAGASPALAQPAPVRDEFYWLAEMNKTAPAVTPYLGLGYGHRAERGVQVHADAGVAYGRAKVTLSPSASLAVKVRPADELAQQASVQDKADRYRACPVLKTGVGHAF